jgi:hypothetical protein
MQDTSLADLQSSRISFVTLSVISPVTMSKEKSLWQLHIWVNENGLHVNFVLLQWELIILFVIQKVKHRITIVWNRIAKYENELSECKNKLFFFFTCTGVMGRHSMDLPLPHFLGAVKFESQMYLSIFPSTHLAIFFFSQWFWLKMGVCDSS